MIPVWLIPPTETPLPWSNFMPMSPLTCLLDQIIQSSLQPSLNTMLSSPTVDIRTVSRHRIPSQHHRPECIWGPTSSVTLTDRLFRYIYLFSSPKFANHRYNKGSEDQWLWAAASLIPWALIDSGLRMIRRMTCDHTSCHSGEAPGDKQLESASSRHRAMETIVGRFKTMRRLRYYLLILAGCGRIKDVLNYIRVSEVSIMSTRWNSFKWIFYLARIFSRQSSNKLNILYLNPLLWRSWRQKQFNKLFSLRRFYLILVHKIIKSKAPIFNFITRCHI